MKKRIILPLIAILFSMAVNAQDRNYAKRIVKDLCSEEMAGRGYVNNGVNKAANYIGNEFRKLGLKKFAGSYYQEFGFPINTFPYPIKCRLDEKELKVGEDFLLSPVSGPCNGTYELLHYDLKDSLDEILYQKKKNLGLANNEVFVLKNTPTNFEALSSTIKIQRLNKKLMHALAPISNGGCELIFHDSTLDNAGTISIEAKNKKIDLFSSRNVIAYIPAKKKKNRKKYIVFTAHYDHLGMMGDAMFPGASDNASGTAMVLNLAKYYSKRNNEYSIVFILFAGEEAGLIGSDYFTSFPTFNIQKIKMLINLHIMGSAEGGVVTVNATEFPRQFATLQKINRKKGYLPEVRKRGPTKNSDHYHFYKKGIPSFFIYSIGGPGFYHDVYDKAESIPMTNYENVFKLLVDFVSTF